MKKQESENEVNPRSMEIEVKKGFFIGCLIHLVALPILMVTGFAGDAGIIFFFFGLVQLIYMIPAILFAKFREASSDYLKGMALSAALVFLLNAACFGIMVVGVAFGGPWYG